MCVTITKHAYCCHSEEIGYGLMTVHVINSYVWESHTKQFSHKIASCLIPTKVLSYESTCLVVSEKLLGSSGCYRAFSVSTRTKQPFRLILYKR